MDETKGSTNLMKHSMKQMTQASLTGLFILATSACTNLESPQDGNSALGIAEFQVTEQAGSQIEILGLDADGNTLATVRLRHGQIADPEDGHLMQGRELVVSFNERKITNAGNAPGDLSLALPDSPNLRELLLDSDVSGPLARWGFTFIAGPERPVAIPSELIAEPAAGETAYAACMFVAQTPTCQFEGCGNPGTTGTASSCQQNGYGYDTFEERCCPTTIARRQCPGLPYQGQTTTSCGANLVGPRGCCEVWKEPREPGDVCDVHEDGGVCSGFVTSTGNHLCRR